MVQIMEVILKLLHYMNIAPSNDLVRTQSTQIARHLLVHYSDIICLGRESFLTRPYSSCCIGKVLANNHRADKHFGKVFRAT